MMKFLIFLFFFYPFLSHGTLIECHVSLKTLTEIYTYHEGWQRRLLSEKKHLIKLLEKNGFVNVRHIFSGGAGHVFGAKNKKTGEIVAVKINYQKNESFDKGHVQSEVNLANTTYDEAQVRMTDGKQKNRFLKVSPLTLQDANKTYQAVQTPFVPWRPGSTRPAVSLRQLMNTGFFGPFEKKGEIDYSKSRLVNKRFDEIVRQLLFAIKITHQAKVVHRDLHLNNVLVSYDENNQLGIHVIDFGGAAQEGKYSYVNKDDTGNDYYFYGNPSFTRVEQFDSTAGSSFKDDLYAFSIIYTYMKLATMGARGMKDAEFSRVFHQAPFDVKDPLFQLEYLHQFYDNPLLSTQQRLVDMAYTSTLSSSVEEKLELVHLAKKNTNEFLEYYSRQLQNSVQKTSSRYVVREILMNPIVLEKFDVESGLKLSPAFFQEILPEVYYAIGVGEYYQNHPEKLTVMAPYHHYLPYKNLEKKIKSLKKVEALSPSVFSQSKRQASQRLRKEIEKGEFPY